MILYCCKKRKEVIKMSAFYSFVILSIINVIGSTIRSLTTINSGKTVASLVSGIYFAFYNIVLVATVADFPMWQKCIITFVCNVLGVYIVKFVEEKMRKDKLWKIEVTCRTENSAKVIESLEKANIPFNYIKNVGKHTVFNIYCATQNESLEVSKIIKANECKYFVNECKGVL